MKNLLILAVFMLFTTVTTKTFAADFDVGQKIEKATTLEMVAEQHGTYVSLGWETRCASMQEHRTGNFVLIVYNQGKTDFAYASNIVEGLSDNSFEEFRVNVLKAQLPDITKPKPDKAKIKTRVGSSGGLPYTHAKRVAHA